MSPDEPVVAAFIAATQRRARLLAAVEASAWAVGGAGFGAGAALAWRARPAVAALVSIAVAVIVGAIWLARRWRERTARVAVVRRIERAEPALRNLLVTADELRLPKIYADDASGRGDEGLRAAPFVRARVFADAARTLRSLEPTAGAPRSSAIRAAAIASGVWLIVAIGVVAARVVRSNAGPGAGAGLAQSSGRAASAGALHVTATVQPPAYTRLPAQTLVDPPQVQAVEGSALALTIAVPGDRVAVEHDGASRTLTRGADGRFTDRLTLAKTGFLVISSNDGGKRIVPLVIAPDALPVVRLTAPGRDLIYSGGNPRIAFDARASDDFGVRDLSLHYTKVSGSGEQFEFKEGTIPLAIARGSAREWRGTASRALAELDLKEGDMLVYRAVASDARPGDGSASSDAFFIEISKLGVAAGDSFTLPEEETRYALSQQMLIVKTERLIKQQPSMAAAAVAEAALNLAVEQRMIRTEFVFMLGGEVQDEEVEAQESTELQEGRQQNRGQQDVRAATQAMSVAGKYLTGVDLAPALAAERAAVAALQRAFSKDRYLLRALATRSQLDMTRRLTGDLSEASDWRRRIADVPANRRAALLQDLLKSLGGIASATAGSESGRRDVLVLAEQTLRIDPDSPDLRQASADLQRIAETWDTSPADRRLSEVSAVAARVAGEAKKVMAAAPAGTSAAATELRGAFADALRAREGAR